MQRRSVAKEGVGADSGRKLGGMGQNDIGGDTNISHRVRYTARIVHKDIQRTRTRWMHDERHEENKCNHVRTAAQNDDESKSIHFPTHGPDTFAQSRAGCEMQHRYPNYMRDIENEIPSAKNPAKAMSALRTQ
jgi:hypothetical protein